MAILAHLAVVIGMVLIGLRHYDNIRTGIAAATLYLLLPYTAEMTGRVPHVLPGAIARAGHPGLSPPVGFRHVDSGWRPAPSITRSFCSPCGVGSTGSAAWCGSWAASWKLLVCSSPRWCSSPAICLRSWARSNDVRLDQLFSPRRRCRRFLGHERFDGALSHSGAGGVYRAQP